jgi:hypothetical protein
MLSLVVYYWDHWNRVEFPPHTHLRIHNVDRGVPLEMAEGVIRPARGRVFVDRQSEHKIPKLCHRHRWSGLTEV